MAKTFSIKRDPTFTTAVNLPSPGQDPVSVDFTFKWMDRKSLVKFNEARYTFAKSFAEYVHKEGVTAVDIGQFAIDLEFPQLKSIVAGWAVEEEFNDENLLAFVESGSELPAAVVEAYLKSYDKAIEGN